MVGVQRFFAQPLHDYVEGLLISFRGGLGQALILIAAAFMLSWWIYVPIHELSHAYGCILAGGTVTRLEMAPIYGAAWLQQFFPFISVGSDYAGRLSGFDTHDSDLVYLVTDATPFLWTVLIGVPLLRAVTSSSIGQRIQFGASLPIAFAPFVSLIGDYYEMGSILVSRVGVALKPNLPVGRWRSDDVFRLVDLLWSHGDLRGEDVIGIGASAVLGTLLAFGTYWVGVMWSDLVRSRKAARRENVA
jgi:hypothetical protein